MNFDFSEDQQQLRDAVARWVQGNYDFERRRRIVAAGGFERAAYGEAAGLGLTGICVDEAHGGLGMGPVEAMIVLEELGRGLVLEPLAQALICAGVIAGFGSDALQQGWLGRIASGTALVVLAHQERGARYRLDACAATAVRAGDAYALTGVKNIVPAGDQADAWLVPATLDGTPALFLVERGTPGVEMRGYLLQDGSRGADVAYAQAAATLVTTSGAEALARAADIGIVATCADGVGAMEETLRLTAAYMQQRKQFGVPIASFQALRHRIADMKMALELARSMSYYAALKLDAPAPERRRALAQAKVQLGQSLRRIGQESVQLHGGIGVTDEYIGSHYFKHLTQLEMTWGDTLHHLGEVSARMTETAGVFV